MNLSGPAEMHTGRKALISCPGARAHRSFPTLAAAVRYAVERQAKALPWTTIECGDLRLQDKDIIAIYESEKFRAVKAEETPSSTDGREGEHKRGQYDQQRIKSEKIAHS